MIRTLFLVAALGSHWFHYKDHVRVLEGFYGGCIGIVESQRDNDTYEVDLYKCGREEVNSTIYVKSENLELLKKK
jgi:hypothetical protein